MMKNVYTVGQVNRYISNMFAQDFMMNRIYVRGEVSNCKYHPTGHIYFTLKDESGALGAVMFSSSRKGLAFPMKNGDNVIVLGSVSVYERDGKYQLYAKEIILDGAGMLHQRFEALKQELLEMGMFAEEYKQTIPRYASRVGIVTAPTGAAIRDIQNIANRRNPYVQLILYPALVQGEGAVESVVQGIETLDELGLDILIVGRGGGSMEDLWAFNEEAVARAIFNCRTPVISAVGHETDVTIADYVADLRAPTPSAAAELAVYDVRELLRNLSELRMDLNRGISRQMEFWQDKLRQQDERLRLLRPENLVNARKTYSLDLEQRLRQQMERKLLEVKHRLQLCVQGLEGASPLKKLSQGYSVATNSRGESITDAEQVQVGDVLGIQLYRGRLKTKVTEVLKDG